MNVNKVLLEEPKLFIQVADDGTWLHFSSADKSGASINLDFLDKGRVIGNALAKWLVECREAAQNGKLT